MKKETTTFYYPIPGYIQTEIEKKGFYLYEWVDEAELKASIERDFLKIFGKYGIALGFIPIILCLIAGFIGGWNLALGVYAVLLTISSTLVFLYIFVLSLKRSLLLRRIAFIIITNKYFRILDTIEPIKNQQLYGEKEIHEIGTLFEEELFRDSAVKKSKHKIFREASDTLTSGYDYIFKGARKVNTNSKEGEQLIFIFAALYTLYLLSIGILYGVGIFIVLVLGNIFSFLNKQYLLARRNKIISISEGFRKIDDFSKNIEKEKIDFLQYLQEAKNSEWKDGLLLKIERSVEDTNKYASETITATTKLRNDIKDSQYENMFDFHVFQNWIKQEIITPLKAIQDLLQKNLQLINSAIKNTDTTSKKYKNTRNEVPLLLSQKRLEIQKDEIIKLSTQLDLYIQKLES